MWISQMVTRIPLSHELFTIENNDNNKERLICITKTINIWIRYEFLFPGYIIVLFKFLTISLIVYFL